MKGGNRDKPKKEFDEMLLEVRRVTRVTTWGRRMSFRATVIVGNKKGKIWLGVAKGADVSIAVKKASGEAYKAMFDVPRTKAFTVPYPVTTKYKSCLVKLIPATWGTGLKAGSSIRAVLELAGYENILSKMIGSNNKLNNALATIKALCNYKHSDYFAKLCSEKLTKKTSDEEKEDEVVESKKVEVKAEEAKPVKKAVAKVEEVKAE